MKRFLANTLVPGLKTVRGRSYSRHLDFLSKSQWWSPEALRDFQWRELQVLLKIAFESVPFYKYKYAGIHLEDVRNWDDFKRLPILTRQEVQQHLHELQSTSYRGKLQIHSTGGSSGEPARFYRSIESYDWRTAATTRVYGWSGLHPGESSLHLWGAPVGKPALSAALRTNLHHWAHNQIFTTTFAHSETLWREIHLAALKRRPKHLVGFVSSLVGFAKFIEKFSLPLPPLISIISAAEMLSERQREYLEGVLRAPVFNTYGCREFMSIGGECESHEGLHLNAENLLVETDGAESAGGYPILVSDLHNHATIFLRYAVGDVGLLSTRNCSCGRGLPMLERVVGRQNEILRLSDGVEVSPNFFRHVLKDVEEILQYQVVQLSPSQIALRVVALPALSETGRNLIQAEFKKVLGTTSLSIEVVKEIKTSRTGKAPLFVSVVAEHEGPEHLQN